MFYYFYFQRAKLHIFCEIVQVFLRKLCFLQNFYGKITIFLPIFVFLHMNMAKKRKIVFRDISEQPEFWLDETGAIVNGDCYWIDINDSILESTLYLALAVANSKFIEKYYDAKFNTKLYSGKRRYMSQYVEQFPIPFANTDYARKAIDIVKKIIAGSIKLSVSIYMNEIDEIVNEMFIAN